MERLFPAGVAAVRAVRRSGGGAREIDLVSELRSHCQCAPKLFKILHIHIFWPFLEGTLFGFGRSEIVAEPTFLYQDKYRNVGESNRAIVIVLGLVFRINETPDTLFWF